MTTSSFQAKGAANGGLAAQLLEKQAHPFRDSLLKGAPVLGGFGDLGFRGFRGLGV